MSAATQTTNTAVTKKKLPMDRVFVQFECYQQSEKTDATGKTETIFEYKPIHSYKLYLFYKKNDQFFRMPDNGITGNVAIAQPIATLDDHPEYLIPEADVGKCNYAFKKGATYYGYFAGRELSEAEVTALRGERSYVLLKMAPTATGVLRIDQSLFWWICLLQQLEVGLTGDEALTKINAIYKSNFAETENVSANNLLQLRSFFSSDLKLFIPENLVSAIISKCNNQEPIWEHSLAKAIEQIPDNPKNTPPHSSEKTFQKTFEDNYDYPKMRSDVFGIIIAEHIKPQLKLSGADIVVTIEDFYYLNNDSKLIYDYLNQFYVDL